SVLFMPAETAVDDMHTECSTGANTVVKILYLHQLGITPSQTLGVIVVAVLKSVSRVIALAR
ncbi:hypothetical protein P692DRAFT_20750952, partial [Suillus brevipes Sb2]